MITNSNRERHFLKDLVTISGTYRRTLLSVVMNDIRHRYSGSILGLAWLVLYPLIFLAIYSGVYLFIFKIRIPELSNWNYILMVFCGLVPYIGFSETLQQGSQSLTSNQNLLKNTVFPTSLIPAKTVLCAQIVHAAALSVLILLCLLSGHLTQKVFLVPIIFIFQAAMLQGIVWIISVIAVVIKDVQYLINLFLLLLLFVSPIAFTAELVPAALKVLLYLNPLYYVISLYRECLFGNVSFHVGYLGVLGVLSCIIFLTGFWFFRKFEEKLWEYV